MSNVIVNSDRHKTIAAHYTAVVVITIIGCVYADE